MRVDNVVARRTGGLPRRRSLMTTPWWRFGAGTAPGETSVARWVAAAALTLVFAVPMLEALNHAEDGVQSGAATTAALASVDDLAVRTPARGRDAGAAAVRGQTRQKPAAPPAKPKAAAPAKPKAAPRKPKTALARPKAVRPAIPARPRPVAGLTQAQMDNAALIVKVGQQAKLPKRAQIIAVATAMQESTLRNLANPSHPQSLKLPNQGTGLDFDSLGLFQQRPASGWGSPSQIMNPAYASRAFYDALLAVSGWQSLPLTVAAQTVQGSAFPDAYARHESIAIQVVNAVSR